MSQQDLHVVIGLGVTGLSCARFLAEQGIPVAVTDTRDNPPQYAALKQHCPDVPVSLGGLDDKLLAKATCIVISPGMALSEPAIAKYKERGVPIIGDVELFAQYVKAPVIAITGTNAKSTVTTLVGMMAAKAGYRVQVGGNLGVPVLDLLAEQPDTNLYVLELSSFQLETTYSLKPKVATVLNVTPDHMDRYGTLADYKRAKHQIYNECDIAVCNRDDDLTEADHNRKVHFTMRVPGKNEYGLIVKNGIAYLGHGDICLLPVDKLQIRGRHNQANALAALAIGDSFGFPQDAMLDVLQNFKGLLHRCQFIRELNGVRWYNDSKGTNVGATNAAIEGLGNDIEGKIVLIAGGVGKNADFSSMLPIIKKYVRHVVLIGEAASELASLIGASVPCSLATSMDEAVVQAKLAAKEKDCVLLSPACASFDMFKNYEHRGEVFTKAVETL
jgi:UDP-N-acetylmuramoylalanine--D-glutamate ligase